MRNTALIAVAIAAVALTQTDRSSARIDSRGEQENPVAPEFVLTDLSGLKLALSQFRGKVVLLDFWATWCAPCRDELPDLVRLQARFGKQGFHVIGISLDDTAAPVRGVVAEFKLNYPVALGDARLAERYGGILGLPVAFLIDRNGRIAKKYAGATDPAVVAQDVERQLRATGAAGDRH